VARILIVGGGCRGRRLAAELVGRGHALRVTTRAEHGRAGIEATGAECWIGTPDRLATLRGALDGVTVACWLLAQARGEPAELQALHGSRLEFFLGQAIDTTVRGFVYDASPGNVSAELLAQGTRLVGSLTELNAIPARVLAVGGELAAREQAWLGEANAAIDSLLAGGRRT
jgi:hypothetical protein